MTADLHTHTTASDGQYTPTELVRLAKQHGLHVLAITDHDTIVGVDEAQKAGETVGLCVLRGVELSAKEHHNFHILGYGFRNGNTELSRLCEKLRKGRDDRKYRIIDFLREKVKRFKADARTCVEAIKSAGGKVSLAHPYQMGLPDDELETLVVQLKDWGLDAIECYYPKYTAEQPAFYLRLVEKYRLRQTGGSDFHGEKVKPDVQLARWPLEMEWLMDA